MSEESKIQVSCLVGIIQISNPGTNCAAVVLAEVSFFLHAVQHSYLYNVHLNVGLSKLKIAPPI